MRFLQNERGSALIELAIAVPFLALLMVGVVDIGRFMYDGILVGNSARAGATYGAQNLRLAMDTSGMQNIAKNDANISGLSPTATHMCVCADGTASTCQSTDCPYPNHRLTYVSVNSSKIFTTLLRYPGLPQSVTINRTVVMQVPQ